MGEAQARARQQQRVEELCAASVRALAGDAALHFRGGRLHQGSRALPLDAPHLQPKLELDGFGALRGAADALALRLVHSDAELHRRLAPADPIERQLFGLLEQLRVESLAPVALPGLRHNLAQCFWRWAQAYVDSRLAESARGMLLLALVLAVRARLTNEPTPEALGELVETTRAMLVRRIARELYALGGTRHDQRAYAAHARAMAATVAALLASRDDERGAAAGTDAHDDERRAALERLLMPGEDAGSGVTLAASGASRVLAESADGYRVYTRAYDREVEAATLVRSALLGELRERLDRRIAAQRMNFGRLARQLQALLARPQADGWDGAQEDGRIDGRRLAQLVASPAERRLFRQERIEPHADTLLTFLVDCSGSMKEPIEAVAMIVDVLARALEMAGAGCEVLGFTTGAWNGGRTQRDWMRAGRPRHPGRLNEVCHMVFKSADTPWRRARRGIAALLKADLFREGIDGEAVDWAVARMHGRAERRRILLVVSDGSPMDAATALANDEHYLGQHLRDVVQRHEAVRDAEIAGIGVGLDLSPYYTRSQVLDLSAPPGPRVFQEILELIAGHGRR